MKIVMLLTFFYIGICSGGDESWELSDARYIATSTDSAHYSEDYSDQDDKESIYDYQVEYDDIYNILRVNDTEKQLRQANVNMDLPQLLKDIVDGNGDDVGKKLVTICKDALVGELLLNKELMFQIVIIVLLGSIFVNLASSFGSGFISENGFYITYLIITSIMLVSFVSTMDMAYQAIERMLVVVKIVVPLYALAMNFVGQTVASAGMYELVMVGIWIVQVIILRFILPMIKFYVIISLINNLNQEDSFSKMGTLVTNIVNWVLKTTVYFILGLNVIKGLIEPQIDAIGRSTVNRLSTIVPGGGIVSALTGTFLGAGAVVKNSIGVAGIIILLGVVMIPIIKILFIMLTVRITSVMIQPIGEKRYVDGVEALAKGNQMLLHTMFGSVVLFLLTVAIVAYSAKGV